MFTNQFSANRETLDKETNSMTPRQYLSGPSGNSRLTISSTFPACAFVESSSTACVWSYTADPATSAPCCRPSADRSSFPLFAASLPPGYSSGGMPYETAELNLERSIGFSSFSCSWGLDFHLSGVRGVKGVIFLGVIEGLPAPDSFSISPEGLNLLKERVHITKYNQLQSQNEIFKAET